MDEAILHKSDDASGLSILLLFQGRDVRTYRDHLCDFLQRFRSPPIVVQTVAEADESFDHDLLARLGIAVDSSDAAIAILTRDDRPASAAGNIWLEIGFWLGRKQPATIIFACHQSVESIPPTISNHVVLRFASEVELEAYVARFVSSLPEQNSTGEGVTDQQDRIDKKRRSTVFISYSHADSAWLERVLLHLKPLEREGIIDVWADTRLRAGSRWKEEIQTALATAKVAVLLVSASFLASDFIVDNEIPTLLSNAKREGASIIPFIIKPSRFSHDANLSQFQALNDPARPLLGLSEYEQEVELVKLSEAVELALSTATS